MDRPQPNFTAHLGYWGAAAAGLFAFASAGMLYSQNERWTNLAEYVATFRDTRLLLFAFRLALAPLVVIAMGSLHALAEGPKRALSRLSFGFALPYAMIVGIIYVLQLTYVRQRILRGDVGADLELWIVASPNSVLFSIGLLGYFFLGLSTLFAAPLFSGSRLESGLRALLVLHGVTGVVGLIAPVYAPGTSAAAQQVAPLLGIVWGVTFGTIMALLAILFRHLAGRMVTVHPPLLTVQRPVATQTTIRKDAPPEEGHASFARPPSAFK